MNGKRQKSDGLLHEAAHVLRLKGYAVPDLDDVRQDTFLATKNDLIQVSTLIVCCNDEGNPTNKTKLFDLCAQIRSNSRLFPSNSTILFISRMGFTDDAISYASVAPGLVLKTISELDRELVNFKPYVDWYIHSFEFSESIFKDAVLKQRYVDVYCLEPPKQKPQSLKTTADNWLQDTKNNILFILGEYGSGKTSFCRKFTYDRLIEHKAGSQGALPILINLRQYRNTFSIQQVITDALINYYGVMVASFAAIERLCASGVLLFVLDGFDEMADQSDGRTIADCFRQLFILAELNAKIIVTCRTNFFRSHEDIIALLKEFKIRSNVSSAESIDFSKHGQIVYVEPFNEEQIEEFIGKREGKGRQQSLRDIKRIHDLSDLSTRPVLLDMIVETLPRLREKGRLVNSASLYEEYTDKWTLRDEWRVVLPKEIRQAFCEEIAWWMHCNQSQALSFNLLESLVTDTFSEVSKHQKDLNRFINDLQTCSFLTRLTGTEEFRFAHKSFIEYFVGRRLIKQLLAEQPLPQSDTRQGPATTESRIWREHTTLRVLLLSKLEPLIHQSRSLHHWDYTLAPQLQSMRTSSGAEALSRSIREVLTRNKLSDSDSSIGITEEIATFALEHARNSRVSLERIVKGAERSDQMAIAADLLRLSKVREFPDTDLQWLKTAPYIQTQENLTIGRALSLIRSPAGWDLDTATRFREAVSDAAWRHLLYHCAREGDRYKSILEWCSKQTDAGIMEQVICHYGLRNSLPEEDAELIDEKLILELLQSDGDEEIDLGFRICEALNLTVAEALKFARVALKRGNDEETIRRAISIIPQSDSKQVIGAIRSLSQGVPAHLRKDLKRIEQLWLDRMSSAHEKKTRVPISKEFRTELLWRSFRA